MLVKYLPFSRVSLKKTQHADPNIFYFCLAICIHHVVSQKEGISPFLKAYWKDVHNKRNQTHITIYLTTWNILSSLSKFVFIFKNYFSGRNKIV